MLKTYRTELTLTTDRCDLTGSWRPAAILEAMQEAAGEHSEILGIGRSTLVRQGVVWVVTRIEVKMNRYPKARERISIETFPMPTRRFFFPRYFIFRDEQGEELGYAGSLWVLLDVNERKMIKPDQVLAHLPDNSDLIPPMGVPARADEVGGVLDTTCLMPVYTDIDVNMHVNNCRYVDWCCNALGVDVMQDNHLSRFVVNYDKEILPGQEVRCEKRILGNVFSFCGFVGDERHFDISGELQSR